jgi:hypothetical protein
MDNTVKDGFRKRIFPDLYLPAGRVKPGGKDKCRRLDNKPSSKLDDLVLTREIMRLFKQNLSNALVPDSYFAHPYHSWERGLNEHTNESIRQYLQKKIPFDTLT